MLLTLIVIACSLLVVGIGVIGAPGPGLPGTVVVTQISDSMVRISGLVVAQGGQKIIGLHGDAGADVQLPKQFKPTPYDYDGAKVKLSEAIDVTWADMSGSPGSTAISTHVIKTDNPWRAAIVNDGASGSTDELEVYVKFHD